METLIIGLWGFFFGTTIVILAGSAVAFSRSLRRIGLNAAVSALASAFFAVAFLGGLPIVDADTLARFLSHLTLLVSGLLTYQLFVTLGLLKSHTARRRAILALVALWVIIAAVGWQLLPWRFLALSAGTACLLALVGLTACLRSALRGERLAWAAVLSVFCVLVALGGFGWLALHRQDSLWQVHVMTALAATFYLSTLAYVLWTRYAYLIELHEVMAHGPGYDPVTRMRSNAETGQLVGDIFRRFREKPEPLGMIVLTIANLYTLEQLHSTAAVNSAFFVCAGRLRRLIPEHVEVGRLGKDGFLLIMQNCTDADRLIELASSVESRLRRSVALNTSRDAARLETANTVWVAEIGVGVMIVSDPTERGSNALALGRSMARTAISYASRIAWFDHSIKEIVELPAVPSA